MSNDKSVLCKNDDRENRVTMSWLYLITQTLMTSIVFFLDLSRISKLFVYASIFGASRIRVRDSDAR